MGGQQVATTARAPVKLGNTAFVAPGKVLARPGNAPVQRYSTTMMSMKHKGGLSKDDHKVLRKIN